MESGGDPLAIHVNGVRTQPEPATTAAQAAQLAEGFIRRGYSVDIGLMQVNSRSLAVLGITVERVLDPCTNIRAGAAVLTADYAVATRTHPEGQPALRRRSRRTTPAASIGVSGTATSPGSYGPAGVPTLTAVRVRRAPD